MPGIWDMIKQQQSQQPKYKTPFGVLGGGDDIWAIIQNRIKNGLSPEELQMIQGQAGGQLRGGEQAINESYAGSGLPTQAKLGAQVALRSNIGRNTQNAITQGNLDAKSGGLASFFNLEGLRQNAENSIFDQNYKRDQMRMAKEANSFGWGDILSGLFGLGGKALGGL